MRGIAEEEPIEVFFSSPEVSLPEYALEPITVDNWNVARKDMSVGELQKLSGGNFVINLPSKPVSRKKTRFHMRWTTSIGRYWKQHKLDDYECYKDSSGQHMRFRLAEAQEIVEREKLTRNKSVSFIFQFVAKPKAKKRKAKRKKA